MILNNIILMCEKYNLLTEKSKLIFNKIINKDYDICTSNSSDDGNLIEIYNFISLIIFDNQPIEIFKREAYDIFLKIQNKLNL